MNKPRGQYPECIYNKLSFWRQLLFEMVTHQQKSQRWASRISNVWSVWGVGWPRKQLKGDSIPTRSSVCETLQTCAPDSLQILTMYWGKVLKFNFYLTSSGLMKTLTPAIYNDVLRKTSRFGYFQRICRLGFWGLSLSRSLSTEPRGCIDLLTFKSQIQGLATFKNFVDWISVELLEDFVQ